MTPDIFCLEESRKGADYFGLPWRTGQCREGEGEAVLWCVVHHSPIISTGYRKPKDEPIVYGPCGECPKGKCDRCAMCRESAKPIR